MPAEGWPALKQRTFPLHHQGWGKTACPSAQFRRTPQLWWSAVPTLSEDGLGWQSQSHYLPSRSVHGAAAVMGAEEMPVIRKPEPGQRALIGPFCRKTPFNVTEISLQQQGQLATGFCRDWVLGCILGCVLGCVLQQPPATLSESAICIHSVFDRTRTIKNKVYLSADDNRDDGKNPNDDDQGATDEAADDDNDDTDGGYRSAPPSLPGAARSLTIIIRVNSN